MFNLLHSVIKSMPLSILIFDKNGNIIFLNKSAELLLQHFNVQSISITNFRDLKPYFPELYSYIENYYTNIFTGNHSKYGIKFSNNYIADITFAPYFENNQFKNLSVIIEEKTSHYKKLHAYKTQSLFLKEVMEIKDLSNVQSKSLFKKTSDLLKKITHQNKILLILDSDNSNENYFSTGFSKSEIKNLIANKKLLKTLISTNELKNYELLEKIYFVPNSILKNKGLELVSSKKSMLICPMLKNKNKISGIIVIEFEENIIPYLSMLKQLSLFMQFAPLIFNNYEKTKELATHANYIQSIINEIPHSIIVFDSNFNIELINKQALKNFTPENEKTHISKVVGDEIFSAIVEMIMNKLKTKEISINSRFFNITISKIKLGKNLKYITVLSDITEKVHMEKELREKEKLETIKSFCVTANDRINNPLTIIATKLDIMEHYAEHNLIDKERIRKIVNAIKNQIDRISKTLTLFDTMDRVKFANYANMENMKRIILEDKDKE